MNERYDNQSQNATAANRSAAAGDDILTAVGGATGNKAVTASATGRWVAHQVSFLADDVNPASTTTFPAASASYNAAGWAAGCAPDGICGTATDADSAVQTVQVSIRQGAGNYWNGASFSSAIEVWNTATGTTSWNYGFASGSFPANGSYTIRVRATDVAGNIETPVSATFTYDTVAPALPSALASSPAGPANDNNPEITGTAEAGSTVRVYPTAACTGGAAATGTAAAFASPGLTVAVADDTSTTFKATATDAAGNVSACSTASVTYVEDSTAPALPSALASSPAGPANDNNPEITGTAEAGSTVRVYPTVRLHRRRRCDRHCGGVRLARTHGCGRRRHLHDLQGDGHGCGRQRQRLLERLGHLRRGLDRTCPAERARLEPGRPGERQQPGDHRHCGGRLDGSRLSRRPPAPAAPLRPALRRRSLRPASRSRSPTTPPRPSRRRQPTQPATSAAARPPRSPTSRTRPHPPCRAPSPRARSRPGERQQPGDHRHCRGRLDGSRLHDRGLHGRRGRDRHRCRLRLARLDDRRRQRFEYDLQGNRHRRCGERQRLLDLFRHLRGGLDRAGPSGFARLEPGLARERQQPRDHRLCRSRLDGSGLSDGGLHRRRLGDRHAAAFASPGLTVAVADDTSTTFKATATDAAGNVSGCSSSSVTYVEDSTAPALPSSLASSPVGPANDNNPEITGSAEAGSTVRIYPTAGCTGGAAATGTAAAFASPGLTVAVADDSSTTFKATATDAAGNVSGCSSSSVTYVEDSTAPALPSALASSPVGPANDNNPEITGAPRPARRFASTRRATARAAPQRPAPQLRLPRLASPSRSPTTARRPSRQRRRMRPATSQRLLELIGHVCRGLDGAGTPQRARLEPGFTRERQQPRDHRHRRGRLDGSRVHDERLLGWRRGDRLRGRLREPRADDRGRKRQLDHLQGDRHRRGRQLSAPARAPQSPTSKTRRAPALPSALASSPVSPANDNNPEITGTAEAGSTVRVYTTAACYGGAAATGTAAAFASPGLTIAVADDSSTTFKATATDAAGNVSGCSSSSVTYVEDSTAPALPSARSLRARSRRRTTTTPRSRVLPRQARRFASTRPPTCYGSARRRPAPRLPSRARA